MNQWEQVPLGEVADIVVGFAFKSSDMTEEPGEVRLLRGVNIGQGRLDWNRAAFLSKRPTSVERYELRQGDVVLAMDRPWIEAGLKRARLQASDLPALLVQRVARLRGTDRASTSFLHHTLATARFSAYIQNITTGATVPHISEKQISAYEMPVPPRRAQDAICQILDAVDHLVENNRRRIEMLEEMAQAIYREWFVHFRFPGHEDATFIESHLGPIPEGWEARMFGDLVDLQKTTVDPDEIPAGSVLVGLEHIPRRQLTLDSWEESSEVGSRKARFAKGDILFGKIRPYFHKVSLAPTDGYCSPDALVIRAKPGLEALATSTAFSKEFVDLASATANGTKMPRASWEVLASHPVAVPPPKMLKQFAEAFIPSVTKCQVLMYENKSLRALRDLLLPKLVSGEIDVSDFELDAVLGGVV